MPEPKIQSTTGAGEALCFDKNDFMKHNFSVDEFLHKNRSAPSLEQLRDNLGIYLKDLRASMIDLINEDYADFVSLSANLVGLDHSIETLQRPLEQFRDEIESIQMLIQENESEIRAKLEQKQELRELNRNLQSLKKVYEAIQKLEDLLANQLSEKLLPVDLERAALELIQMKFNEKFCSEYLTAEQVLNISRLHQEVLEKLRALFNEVLKSATSTSSEALERCLLIYITLDSCHIAEKVFSEDVVAPYMSNIICEHSLQNSPQGLAGIYGKILNFIPLHMTDLLRLTQYTDKLRGFNFLLNSFWSNVEMRLETHMASIFAPGNSEVFYAKYKCTRDFLSKIEELLASEQAIKDFRLHKQTQSFQARWNLPVYFQICFQEIAAQFELIIHPLIRNDIFNKATSTNDFQLTAFRAANEAIQRCWSDGVFLSEVFPKFYKLNAQIFLRLSHWIDDIINLINTTKTELPHKLSKIKFLIILHADIKKMLSSMPELQQIVRRCIPKHKQSPLVVETLAKSFVNLERVLSVYLEVIHNSFVDILIADCGLENVRQVNDLPRLYRKTNREVPTRCSAYVEQMLRPLKTFADEQSIILGKNVVHDVMAKVLSKITSDYFTAVTQVLTSVQKTEESLRRLRNLKTGAPNATVAAAATSGTTISDDDKIRLQLRVDVTAWATELAKLNFASAQVDKLDELTNIVEESIKSKDLSGTASS